MIRARAPAAHVRLPFSYRGVHIGRARFSGTRSGEHVCRMDRHLLHGGTLSLRFTVNMSQTLKLVHFAVPANWRAMKIKIAASLAAIKIEDVSHEIKDEDPEKYVN